MGSIQPNLIKDGFVSKAVVFKKYDKTLFYASSILRAGFG
jgi:hypothetical protein